jgi:maltose O-acetyltransferase
MPNPMSEKERMLAGRLYLAFDEELGRDNKKARMLTRLFNTSTEEQQDYRKVLLKQLFRSTGDNIYIEPTFRTDYGCNTSIGENFYANYDLRKAVHLVSLAFILNALQKVGHYVKLSEI